jgi:precorrin-2 dehydrogenase/sirohydrochlorin ferrochelatase
VSGYPIVLVDLAHTPCLVVGGGEVAARKVAGLRRAGARPVVVSPALTEALRRQAAAGEIEAVEREYRRGDLAGVRLVIAATDDPAINEAVWRDAQAAGCLVNVVDDPARCSFHVPATVRRGDLLLTVSTGGHSPLLARRIRQALEAQFDPAYESYVDLLGELRPAAQERVADPGRRRAFWSALLESDVLDLIRQGAGKAAARRAREILDEHGGGHEAIDGGSR